MLCEYKIKLFRGEFQCDKEQIQTRKYCIFHDEENWKVDEGYKDALRNHIQKDVILNGAHLIGYHIPQFSFAEMVWHHSVFFDHAIFHGPVYFTKCQFQNEVSFYNTTFEKEADFLDSIFLKKAVFYEVEFKDKIYFTQTQFKEDVNFYNTLFEKEVRFKNTRFDHEAFFPMAEFKDKADFSGASFNGKTNFSNCTISRVDFSAVDFTDEVDFFFSHFPEFRYQKNDEDYEIPIRFDYATFRKRVRFVGKPNSMLNLETISFKGVDLLNAEFHNVKWLTASFPTNRSMIVDEKIVHLKKNYEEVTKIYNQLRKNYESKLLFNDAAYFFIGELESIRKSLWQGTIREKFLSIPYALYKVMALYGESAALPLLFWSTILVLGLTEVRNIFEICSVKEGCSMLDKLFDSFFAYFLLPRSGTSPLDLSERIISVPILSMGYIALRRRFERRK